MFVLGINFQLVEIDSNRRLSQIVRNSDSHQHRSNRVMEYDGSDEHGIITLYGYYCMLLNDIPHVWHRLVANLEMNSYN